MSLEDLELRRREMGAAAFEMQYQQNPISAEGSPLRWDWFGVYDTLPPRTSLELIAQSWDTATSDDPRADYSVCTTWGFMNGQWLLLDVFRRQLSFPELKQQALRLVAQYEPDVVLIEDAMSGRPLLQELRNSERRRYVGINPIGNKEIRFDAALAPVQEGLVLLPREAAWLPDFKRELQGFPRSAHDDQVDSFSQFMEWTKGSGFRRALGPDHPLREQRREAIRVRPRRRR